MAPARFWRLRRATFSLVAAVLLLAAPLRAAELEPLVAAPRLFVVAMPAPIAGQGGIAAGGSGARFNGGTITAAITCQKDAIGVTSTDCYVATNTTAAAAGAQQWSPRLRWTGQGWKTNATAASQTVDVIAELVPLQEAAAPFARLMFSGQTAGGGYTPVLSILGTNANVVDNVPLAILQIRQPASGMASIGPLAGDDHVTIGNNNGGTVLGLGTWAGGQNLAVIGTSMNGFGAGTWSLTTGQALPLTFGSGDASGSNAAGTATTIIGGRSTGSGAGGDVLVQTTVASGSSSTLNTLATRWTFKGTGGLFSANAIGGDKGADSVNQITGGLYFDGLARTFFVTGDFNTTSLTLATVTGLSWTMPASKAVNVPFRCELNYFQATAAVANLFGIITGGTAPTNLMTNALVSTNTTVHTEGTATITTATSTTVVTATPSAITTVWRAEIAGFIEAPSNASPTTIAIGVATGNASDQLTIKRGSFCVVN